MSSTSEPGQRPAAAILAQAARAAGHAPSVHNTQPWRWRVNRDSLDLYADRSRQLNVTDPVGRLLHVSCGAALHHALVALAAEGWSGLVTLLPGAADPDHLARVVLGKPVTMTGEVMRLFQAIDLRHTDRRPVSDTPVDPAVLAELSQAAQAEGVHLHVLHHDQVLDLAVGANAAQQAELEDEGWRSELAYWAGVARPSGAGVPEGAIPAEATQTTMPSRDFGHAGTLPVSGGHDRYAVFAILYGETDDARGWLTGGEGLSRVWLTATERGVSLLPFSAAIEVDHTRVVLTHLLSHLGYPYLVLRLGIADTTSAAAGPTPRLRADQIIEFAEDARPRDDRGTEAT
jgi:hypothetical protein